MTVVGEAGVGKSRLLDEFASWLELRPEAILYLKGRSVPDLEIVPRGLLRELFAYRFEILDDDPRADVAEKLRDGLAPLEPAEADVVGQWLGLRPRARRDAGATSPAATTSAPSPRRCSSATSGPARDRGRR